MNTILHLRDLWVNFNHVAWVEETFNDGLKLHFVSPAHANAHSVIHITDVDDVESIKHFLSKHSFV